MAANKELLIVAGVALLLILIGAVLAGFGRSPLEAPTLSATVEGNKVILSWEGEGDFFKVYRSNVSGEAGEVIAVVNTTAYVDKPGPGVHYYKVKAFKGSSESPFSNEVEVVLRGSKPTVEEIVPSFEGCLRDDVAVFEVRGEAVESCAYSFDGQSWSEPMAPPLEVEVPDGVESIYIKCYSPEGVEGDVYQVNLSVDRVPPSVSLINPFVENGTLFGVVEASEPVTCSAVLENGTEVASFSVEGAEEIAIPLPFGRYLITITCVDACGNPAFLYYEADNTAGSGGSGGGAGGSYVMEMVINDDDPYTYSRAVVLNIETYNLTHCRFANDDEYPNNWTAWEEAENGEWEKAWTLSEGYGRKKVYMQCRDGEEVVGEVYDTIFYRERSDGGGGGENGGSGAAPVAGVAVRGEAQMPAIPEGLTSLPLDGEGVPFVNVPLGVEDYTRGPHVYATFRGSGERARYVIYLEGNRVYESEWDPAYVEGTILITLPVVPLPIVHPRPWTYTLEHEVEGAGVVARAADTFVYDPVPPTLRYSTLTLTEAVDAHYTFSMGYIATDDGSGVEGYVLEVKMLDREGKPVAHYAYYERVSNKEEVARELSFPTTAGAVRYEARLYVMDKVGNYATEEFAGSLPPIMPPVVVEDVVVGDAEEPTHIIHSRPLVEVVAEGAEECYACIAVFTTPRLCSAPYRPYTPPSTVYKLDLSSLPPTYEGPATVYVGCRNGTYEAKVSERVSVDLRAPTVEVGEAVIVPLPISPVLQILIPVSVRDAHLEHVRLCTQVGKGSPWGESLPDDIVVVAEFCRDVEVNTSSVDLYGGYPVSTERREEYVRVVVEATDEVGHFTRVVSEWAYPRDGAERGSQGDEELHPIETSPTAPVE